METGMSYRNGEMILYENWCNETPPKHGKCIWNSYSSFYFSQKLVEFPSCFFCAFAIKSIPNLYDCELRPSGH